MTYPACRWHTCGNGWIWCACCIVCLGLASSPSHSPLTVYWKWGKTDVRFTEFYILRVFRIHTWQPQIPEHFMPVLFDVRHLMEGDVQALTDPVGVLTVRLCVAHATLIQGVPVLHKNPCDTVTYTRQIRTIAEFLTFIYLGKVSQPLININCNILFSLIL